jgi:hypothetical protein
MPGPRVDEVTQSDGFGGVLEKAWRSCMLIDADTADCGRGT